MRRRYTKILVIILLISAGYLLITELDTVYLQFHANENPRIVPSPVVYGKKTSFSHNSEFDSNLAIVEVIDTAGAVDRYKTAISSVQCYAALKGHFFYLLYTDQHTSICGHHQDFFYFRHCVTANLIANSQHNWYVFIDSDMEVINPNKSFSDYIDERFHVHLFDRFWNWEIVAGSFIIKGSQFGYDFVRGFADFEFEHPNVPQHGTDNGAIQAYVAEIVLNGREKIHECWKIWNVSKDWDNVFDHEWCVRKALGSQDEFDKIKIFRKGTAWARDGFQTMGRWSPEIDFLFHMRKEEMKQAWNPNASLYWFDTRMGELDQARCENGTVLWEFREELIVNRTSVVNSLTDHAKGTIDLLKSLYKRLNRTDFIEKDIIEHKEVVDRFTKYQLS